MKKREVDHSLLDKAKINKKDEFYTQLIDIEKEMIHYTKHFRDKVVYCNCDNPEYSNFWKFFYDYLIDIYIHETKKTEGLLQQCHCVPKFEYTLHSENLHFPVTV